VCLPEGPVTTTIPQNAIKYKSLTVQNQTDKCLRVLNILVHVL
jgi:hypothetical protein